MPKATLFIPTNEPDIVKVHIGTLREIHEISNERVFIFKHKNGSRFIDIRLPLNAEYRVENGHAQLKTEIQWWGQFARRSENPEFNF